MSGSPLRHSGASGTEEDDDEGVDPGREKTTADGGWGLDCCVPASMAANEMRRGEGDWGLRALNFLQFVFFFIGNFSFGPLG